MKAIHEILMEITELTTNMETEFPELYQFLDENPITIPSSNHPNIDVVVLNEYLESLKELLRHHMERHKKS